MEEKKPVARLIGLDGNAFVILAALKEAALKAGWPREKIDLVLDEARSGDYDHLLRTALKYFEVE